MVRTGKIILIAGLIISACTQNGSSPVEVVKYFDNGAMSRRYFEINGQKEGLMTDYHPNGSVKSERMFKNNLQTGRTVFYYPDGQIKEVQFFDENGLKDGGDSTFYENGNLQLLINFKTGKKHGYLQKWSTEGLLTYEARYQMDSLVEVQGELLKRYWTGQ